MQVPHMHRPSQWLSMCGLLLGMVWIAACAGVTGNAGSVTSNQTPDIVTRTITIKIKNFKFVPATVSVVPGTRIVWTNLDEVPHSIVSDNEMFATSGVLNQSDSYSVVLNSPGNYPYHCGIHTFMQAEIQVVAAKSQNPSRARP